MTAVDDSVQMKINSSSSNLLARSKKLPPPPLCLPATNTTIDEEKIINSNQKREQRKSTTNCCLLSSSEDCPHKSIPFTLPASQRPQILDTLMASSSTLLVPPPSETKNKKSYNAAYTNQINLLKQRQSASKVTITDAEWIDFMRLILHKPLERELKLLLDNYKMTYFDRINAPNTADETIRSSLCSMVSEALATYSASSILPTRTTDDLTTNISSLPSTTITNNGNAKRKRKNTSNSLSISAPVAINSQTKFVISHIIPGKYDSHYNGNKMTYQQQLKQFQKKYSHLFKYIPEKDEQEYLIREGHLKNISVSSSRSSNNNNICLMLYDEVVSYMDEYDLELSGISIDDSFALPESILAHIYLSI
ncbi:unnamed protein product [Rotaria sordida]|uniref:Uncharacterized protein n=1 Tax=Rotaria sordida TaxID=392033 RepID=A0A813QWF3_9BILA|nr:unnamed protein product [Rotaria sordida]CAF0783030.1 unnamed protein product [Rotaria sordida]CAF0937480.1 unnamed protein product [Rotaria sordida]